jgi:hypothetical protein
MVFAGGPTQIALCSFVVGGHRYRFLDTYLEEMLHTTDKFVVHGDTKRHEKSEANGEVPIGEKGWRRC